MVDVFWSSMFSCILFILSTIFFYLQSFLSEIKRDSLRTKKLMSDVICLCTGFWWTLYIKFTNNICYYRVLFYELNCNLIVLPIYKINFLIKDLVSTLLNTFLQLRCFKTSMGLGHVDIDFLLPYLILQLLFLWVLNWCVFWQDTPQKVPKLVINRRGKSSTPSAHKSPDKSKKHRHKKKRRKFIPDSGDETDCSDPDFTA